MQTKRIGCFSSILLLFLGLMCSAGASPDTTVSFRGGGVTIFLKFPEEAHPLDNIMHNLTITTNVDIILQNFTVSIKAPVNSGWQEIRKREEIGQYLPKTTPWVVPLSVSLPQEANGTLSCFIYVLTNQTTEPLSYMVYTTQIREMTYSELSADYNLLSNTYYQLLADCDTLNNTYKDLQSNYAALSESYNELSGNYSTLSNIYNELLVTYAALNNTYKELDSRYNNVNFALNSLLGNYSNLQSDYDLLNSTYGSLIENYTSLQAIYRALNETHANLLSNLSTLEKKLGDSQSELNIDKIVMLIFVVAVACLIAFIIYIKRKKPEPYLVIRKETVAMKPDKKS